MRNSLTRVRDVTYIHCGDLYSLWWRTITVVIHIHCGEVYSLWSCIYCGDAYSLRWHHCDVRQRSDVRILLLCTATLARTGIRLLCCDAAGRLSRLYILKTNYNIVLLYERVFFFFTTVWWWKSQSDYFLSVYICIGLLLWKQNDLGSRLLCINLLVKSNLTFQRNILSFFFKYFFL